MPQAELEPHLEDMKQDISLRGWAIGLVVGVFVSWMLFGVLVVKGGDFSKSGTLGDSFGALNTLFSGLAFAGLIITVLMQRSELKLQRRELALARNQASRSADAQEQLAEQEAASREVQILHAKALMPSSVAQSIASSTPNQRAGITRRVFGTDDAEIPYDEINRMFDQLDAMSDKAGNYSTEQQPAE